jgi:beta-glucosidase
MGAGQSWVLATATWPVHAENEDGKGESIWHRFAHSPGTIKDDDTGDAANDPQWPVPVENVHLYRTS